MAAFCHAADECAMLAQTRALTPGEARTWRNRMVWRLIGHYDSPFVRRVGVSLNVLGMAFDRDLLSVFSDADAMRAFNPLVRVPALVLDNGECLIDSTAILDHLDEVVGSERALLPAAGQARRDALQIMALATGLGDKTIAIVYERRKPSDKIDEGWISRCRSQQDGALTALERRYASAAPARPRLMQPEITVACMLGYVRLRQPDPLPAGRYPALDALSACAEAHPAFVACRPSLEEVGGVPEAASRALLRLLGDQQSR
jgi:glutathione S-transferase